MSGHDHHDHGNQRVESLSRVAAAATLHCLTGCAIGEVLGMVIGTAFGLSNTVTIVLAIVLAFLFGYSLTMLPLLRSGLLLAVVLPLALASDTFSIAVMEIVDNIVMVTVPGAMDAGLTDLLFWGSLAFALAIAFVAAWPVNVYLIGRGRGHAVVHQFHGHGRAGDAPAPPPQLRARRLAVVGAAAIAFTVGVGIAGAQIAERGEDEHDATEAAGQMGGSAMHGGPAAASGLASTANGYRVEIEDGELVPGRTEELVLRIVDAHGHAATDFEEHGGVRLHLIVVRRDLALFQHVHPEPRAGGDWRVQLLLPEAGRYRAFADFTANGRKIVLGHDLVAQGAGRTEPLPEPAETTSVYGYRVALDGHAHANDEGELAFTVTRAGRAVDVEPYLGADGHLVVLRRGDLAYLHVHPLQASAQGRIRFMATFPSAATYRLFLQFKDGGRVHTAPFTLHVR